MLPYLSATIPGCGGDIKLSPEDFLVEEIPAYEPCGSGEHVYLLIEKQGITTLEAIRRVSSMLAIPERDIGYAGMKDAIGVTRQYLSGQRIQPEAAAGLTCDGLRVISAQRHTNKLKLGHLRGNRFSIVVRGVAPHAATNVPAIMEVLQLRGVPNYFGYQRYGAQGNSHLIGAAMVRRDWHGAVSALIGDSSRILDEQWRSATTAFHEGDFATALQFMPRHCRSERDLLQRLVKRPDSFEQAFAAVHPRLQKLYLSAYQSSLFDQVVARRLDTIDQIMTGDLACKHANGACFLVEDGAVEAHRAASFEISASGPMFGTKMKQPAGEPLAIEREILDNEHIDLGAFDLGTGLRMEGERRPLRVPLASPEFRVEGDCLQLGFELPKGSYATAVIRELTKTF